jgi:hypothetical protein
MSRSVMLVCVCPATSRIIVGDRPSMASQVSPVARKSCHRSCFETVVVVNRAGRSTSACPQCKHLSMALIAWCSSQNLIS